MSIINIEAAHTLCTAWLGSSATPNTVFGDAEESVGGKSADSRRRSIWDEDY